MMVHVHHQRARYSRPMYACGPEYDEPACCAPEDEQYTGAYGTPYSDHYGSRPSIGECRIYINSGKVTLFSYSDVLYFIIN